MSVPLKQSLDKRSFYKCKGMNQNLENRDPVQLKTKGKYVLLLVRLPSSTYDIESLFRKMLALYAGLSLPVVVLVLVGYFVVLRKRTHRLFTSNGIPGPQPSLLLGNMDEYISSSVPHDILSSWSRKYGNIFGYFIGAMPHLVVKDLELLHKIFIEDFHVFLNRPFPIEMSPYNKSVLGLRDTRWKEVRSIILNIFFAKNIKLMTDMVNDKVNITVDIIAKKAENEEIFDFHELMQGLSVDILADCALAMKTDCQENPKGTFFNLVRDTFKNVQNVFIKLAAMFLPVGKIMVKLHRFSPAGKMTEFVLDSLKKAIAERRENPQHGRVDFLQLMLGNLEDGKRVEGLTNQEILSNSFIFLVAGFETMANSLSFTIYLLMKNPHIQERLFQEIAEAKNDDFDTILSLRYLDQVVNESLRMYPPATLFTSRECSKNYKVGSITIPKGTAVVAPVWDIHHDPDLWTNPMSFNPGRFAPENKAANKHSMAYMPFGIGARKCVAFRFALAELKFILFRLVKEFKFETCGKTEDPLSLRCSTAVVGPANGVFLRAVSRSEMV